MLYDLTWHLLTVGQVEHLGVPASVLEQESQSLHNLEICNKSK